MKLRVHEIDPLQDGRWSDFLARHPDASVFHSPAWLSALARTYGYRPAVLTTAEPGAPLADGLAFCRISSWLTGRRLVSLPFSDHCDILSGDADTVEGLVSDLQQRAESERCRYAELRPTRCLGGYATGFRNDQTFVLHRLNLAPSLDSLFRHFHHSCIQRRIRRAGREDLRFEDGSARPIVDAFHALAARTHQRHGVPVQPLVWFQNLAALCGESMKIHLALKDGAPVAGVLMLRFKDTMTYKYGASDERFHATGAMTELLWRGIQDAKALGCSQFDLGRSDPDNAGLTTFKDHWAASRAPLCYWRCRTGGGRQAQPARIRLGQRLWTYAPERMVELAGRLLYKHAG